MCTDKNIKESLPAYLNGALDDDESARVERHLETCDDCRAEISLLRLMSEETVPDPGEAFWNALPDRIFRGVQQRKTKKFSFDFSWFTGRIAFPRWSFAAVGSGFAVIFTLLVGQSLWKPPARFASLEPVYVLNAGSLGEPINVSQITAEQADRVNSWAGKELVSIGEAVAPLVAENTDTDILDEIADLNINEAERLSDMLRQWKQEG